ncbi:MAG: GCN5-related N-acetyltransferase [Frankiales bacterium]|nr:GCN5-related N-acetyltransferase [Frankiales bacterium]
MRLRLLGEDDLETLGGFFAAPHVARWWHQDAAPEAVAAEYGPLLRGEDPTVVLLALVEDRPVGLAQWYRWDDNPNERDGYGIPAGTVGIDYLIGHPHDCDRGLGTALVAAVLAATPPLPVWVTPEAANEPSRRVLEKNGFALMAVKQCQVESPFPEGPTALYRLAR